MKANAREVETLLKGVITKRERAMKDGHADNGDLLGLMMESNIKETQEAGSSKPTMTTDDIVGELKLFYFAGMETTAVLLTWAMVVLSMHPEWQDRAREEVLRVFGKNHPDPEGINRLKVVSAAEQDTEITVSHSTVPTLLISIFCVVAGDNDTTRGS